ncbi:MAG: DegT/DnrJ/EryC1/StrS family aminotransferase [Aestuariivirga sp.]
MNPFEALGVRTIINAKGPATRLSGGMMRSEVAQAMSEASQYCVDIADLQAAASKAIAEVTGAEAGYVASGASACLLLATAACMTGLDPGRVARLPDATGMKDEVIMVRSQRNFYDHAVRAAGARIVEVGLPDRYAGAGVRDAEAWEIEDAITERTAAVFYVVDASARPPLGEVVTAAHRHVVPVIVDAAAQLPPQSNLKKFTGECADLVAFSGGKALGGPQASGFLCGRRDLIMAAALQHLDLDVFWDMWEPPPSLIDKARLRGAPPHGIGRSCKAGKEEIVGLLAALRLFVAEGDGARHSRWLGIAREIADGCSGIPGVEVLIENAENTAAVPVVSLSLDGNRHNATRAISLLQGANPSIHVDASYRDQNRILLNPMCLRETDCAIFTVAFRGALKM